MKNIYINKATLRYLRISAQVFLVMLVALPVSGCAGVWARIVGASPDLDYEQVSPEAARRANFLTNSLPAVLVLAVLLIITVVLFARAHWKKAESAARNAMLANMGYEEREEFLLHEAAHAEATAEQLQQIRDERDEREAQIAEAKAVRREARVVKAIGASIFLSGLGKRFGR